MSTEIKGSDFKGEGCIIGLAIAITVGIFKLIFKYPKLLWIIIPVVIVCILVYNGIIPEYWVKIIIPIIPFIIPVVFYIFRSENKCKALIQALIVTVIVFGLLFFGLYFLVRANNPDFSNTTPYEFFQLLVRIIGEKFH
jgi:Ca2+/H+ antiporter